MQAATPKTRLGQSLIRGMEQALAHARGEIQLRTRVIYTDDAQFVRSVRETTGLSQTQFAKRYGISVRTLQDWEQGRSRLESAIRAYLLVIRKHPAVVADVLRKAS